MNSELNEKSDVKYTKNKLPLEGEENKAKRKGRKQAIAQTIRGAVNVRGGENRPNRKSRAKLIRPEIDEYIHERMIDPDENGDVFIKQYIDAFLNRAKTDPESAPAKILANSVFGEGTVDRLDRILNEKIDKDLKFAEYQIRKTLFDRQREVYDNDTDKIIQIICSRRAGKSELDGRLVLKRLLKPNQHVVYINRSFDAAVRQLTKPYESAMKEAGNAIHPIQGSLGGGLVRYDNGSWLLILGNNNASDINKVRGESVSLAIIDEQGHLRHLRELLQEVIQPATIDYADSQIILTGTPPRTKESFVKQLWDNPEIKHYHWTFMDNPYIPNKDEVIEQVCKLNGVDPDSMFIRREYFGDMDAYDKDAMLIKRMTVGEAPKDITYSHAWVGVDWGDTDKAAVVAVLGDAQHRKMYVVNDWSQAKAGGQEMCNRAASMVDWLGSKYRIARPIQVICDNNEKSLVRDLYNVYKMKNVCTAYKYDKDIALDQLNDWCGSSTIIVSPEAKNVVQDFENAIWIRDEDTDRIVHELDEEAYHMNAGYCVLYVSRQFAWDILGLREHNKPAKEAVTAEERVAYNMTVAGEGDTAQALSRQKNKDGRIR